MADFRIETERLVLRDWRAEDWQPYFAMTNTPAVMRWLGGVQGRSRRRRQRGWFEHCRRRDGHTYWLVERKPDGAHLGGQILGFCGLKRVDDEGAPIGDFEIGWRLREDAWGHGYAKEAAQASLTSAFDQFGAPHVVALTAAANAPSRGLMVRLGMKRRADLDFNMSGLDPREGSVVVYAMTDASWRARR